MTDRLDQPYEDPYLFDERKYDSDADNVSSDEQISDWPSKRPSTWTDAERAHVHNLVHGGCNRYVVRPVPDNPPDAYEGAF